MLDHEFAKSDPRFEIVYAAEYDHDAGQYVSANTGRRLRNVTSARFPDRIFQRLISSSAALHASRSAMRTGMRTPEALCIREGDMFAHYLRLVRESGVRAFLIENVPGLFIRIDGTLHGPLSKRYCRIIPYPQKSLRTVILADTQKETGRLNREQGRTPVIPDVKMRPVRTTGEALSRVKPDLPNFFQM